MARNSTITIQGKAYPISTGLLEQVNADGTVTCGRCGNRLPQQTDESALRIGIYFDHSGIMCRPTERELMG